MNVLTPPIVDPSGLTTPKDSGIIRSDKECVVCGYTYTPSGTAQKYCATCKPLVHLGRACTHCGDNPATGASPWCRQCLTEAEANRRRRLKSARICEYCAKAPIVPDRRWCTTCADLLATRSHVKRKDNKRLAFEWAGGKCADCGFVTDVLEVYDFHHLDPSVKDFTLGYLVNTTWKKMLPELEKCVMLCSNCHRIRHHKLQ